MTEKLLLVEPYRLMRQEIRQSSTEEFKGISDRDGEFHLRLYGSTRGRINEEGLNRKSKIWIVIWILDFVQDLLWAEAIQYRSLDRKLFV